MGSEYPEIVSLKFENKVTTLFVTSVSVLADVLVRPSQQVLYFTTKNDIHWIRAAVLPFMPKSRLIAEIKLDRSRNSREKKMFEKLFR